MAIESCQGKICLASKRRRAPQEARKTVREKAFWKKTVLGKIRLSAKTLRQVMSWVEKSEEEAYVDGMEGARERVGGNTFRDGGGKWIRLRGGVEEWSYVDLFYCE